MNSFKVLTSSESNEWYTPPEIIEAARDTMGSIALDPATCEQAQGWIKAEMFYTQECDGFVRPWRASTLWLNCPYGQRSRSRQVHGASAWLQKAIDHYKAGDIGQAVLLCRGDSTAVKWLHEKTICCIADRISFVSPTDEGGNPVPGTKIFYLGINWRKFHSAFKSYGAIVVPYDYGVS